MITIKDKLTPVIMISGHATVQIAVEATRLGAYEFIEKPFSKEKILNYVNRALESLELKKKKIIKKTFRQFHWKKPSIMKAKELLKNYQLQKTSFNWTYQYRKELIARKIHKNSIRSHEPFVIINVIKSLSRKLFGEEFEDGLYLWSIRKNKGTLLINEVSIPYETGILEF